MVDSLISNDKRCVVCKTTENLHRHHIYEGFANRPKSEKFGCWCYLCARHHNMSSAGVHFNKQLEMYLKKKCQKAWEAKYGSREDFMKTFGRNYL